MYRPDITVLGPLGVKHQVTYLLDYYVSQLTSLTSLYLSNHVVNFSRIDDGPLLSFQGRSSSYSYVHASLFQATDRVMSLALCPQVVSQAPQHFRSSETQATCEGLLCPPVCLLGHFPSLRLVRVRAIHRQEFLKVDIDHWHIPIWTAHSTFHFL